MGVGKVDRGGRRKGPRIGRWKKRPKFYEEHRTYLEIRLAPLMRAGKRSPYLCRIRRAKIYLVPLDKPKSLGDTVIVIFPRRFVAFLDHVDVEDLSNGERWFTLHYDCMELDFVLTNLGKMTDPGFPWEEIAQAASSCIIEVSVEAERLKRINDKILEEQRKAGLSKPIQQVLDAGSWWGLAERATPAPNTLVGLKHEPYWFSDDPTTIVSAGLETPTVIGDIAFPDGKLLKALIAVSHPGELADRYPGR